MVEQRHMEVVAWRSQIYGIRGEAELDDEQEVQQCGQVVDLGAGHSSPQARRQGGTEGG